MVRSALHWQRGQLGLLPSGTPRRRCTHAQPAAATRNAGRAAHLALAVAVCAPAAEQFVQGVGLGGNFARQQRWRRPRLGFRPAQARRPAGFQVAVVRRKRRGLVRRQGVRAAAAAAAAGRRRRAAVRLVPTVACSGTIVNIAQVRDDHNSAAEQWLGFLQNAA